MLESNNFFISLKIFPNFLNLAKLKFYFLKFRLKNMIHFLTVLIYLLIYIYKIITHVKIIIEVQRKIKD